MNRRPPQPRDRTLPESRSTDRKERNRKKPDLLAWARAVVVLALVAQCLRVAFASPRLRLQEVRVSGSQRFTPDEVIRRAGVPVGKNIFRVNLGEVSRRLQAEPVLRDAVVTRELPSRLNVELTERQPALQIASEGKTFNADDEGVVFEEARALNPKLPLMELKQPALPPLGGRLHPDLVAATWECVRLARKEGLTLGKMRVDGPQELWLNIATYPTSQPSPGPLAVRIGRWSELPEKFRDIHQALQSWPDLTAHAAYLNVMCAGSPALMNATDDKKVAAAERSQTPR
jgi:cell division septal protein FtsQ